MKTYLELVNEVKEEIANGGKRSFSRELFNELTAAYLNDVENNKTTIAKTKNGELVEEEINVPLDFRKNGNENIIRLGVDKQEAERILTNDYQFKDVSAI